MANHASAKKRARQTIKRTARNRHIRTERADVCEACPRRRQAGDADAAKKALVEAVSRYRRRGLEGHLPPQDRLAVHLAD